MTVYFDMDGTIADLYGVENWLPKIREHNVSPYLEAKPLLNMAYFARLLHQLQDKGYEIGIISWTSRDHNDEFHEAVKLAKHIWLREHLPSVKFNYIHIDKYGIDKNTYCSQCYQRDILFDDDICNRHGWSADAYPPIQIIPVLKNLIAG